MTPQGPWADSRLRAAWAARNWAVVFRRYRSLTGVTQAQLGALTQMAQAHVSTIERGKRLITSVDVIRRITEGLAVPSELTGLPEPGDAPVWSPNPELSDRIAHAQRTGRIDIGSANWIAHVLAEQRRTEDQVGGVDLWVVVRSQLDTVTRLLPDASRDVADRLLILSAEHAHWLSWVAHQEGHTGAALEWLNLASGWAVDAGSADMTSWVARVRSLYTLKHGDPRRALRIAESAHQGSGALSPAAEAIAAHANALALAAIGDRDESRRLSARAYELALQAPDAEERPGWLYWLDPLRAKLLVGDAAYSARDWATAVGALQEAVTELTDYPRDQAYYLGRLEDARRRL